MACSRRYLINTDLPSIGGWHNGHQKVRTKTVDGTTDTAKCKESGGERECGMRIRKGHVEYAFIVWD